MLTFSQTFVVYNRHNKSVNISRICVLALTLSFAAELKTLPSISPIIYASLPVRSPKALPIPSQICVFCNGTNWFGRQQTLLLMRAILCDHFIVLKHLEPLNKHIIIHTSSALYYFISQAPKR